jgi:hypothetical protein
MRPSTFDVKEKRSRISVLKIGKLWVFKHLFGDKELLKELVDYYNRDGYRFEFKTIGERNKALKILEFNGFETDLVEDLSDYLVKMDKSTKYAPVLKNSVEYTETLKERIFVMKDLASVEEAPDFGAEAYEGDAPF